MSSSFSPQAAHCHQKPQRPFLHCRRPFFGTKQPPLFDCSFPSPSLTQPPLIMTPSHTCHPTTTNNKFLRCICTLSSLLSPRDQCSNCGCSDSEMLRDDCLHQRESLYHDDDVQIAVFHIHNDYVMMVQIVVLHICDVICITAMSPFASKIYKPKASRTTRKSKSPQKNTRDHK